MRKYLFSIFTLILFLILAFDLSAQKLQVKSIMHQQYTPDNKGELTLSMQIKKEFNEFNKLTLQENSSAGKGNTLQLDRQQRFSYDSKGRHQNTMEYNGEGTIQSELKLHWDKYNNNNKIEQTQYENGNKTSVAVTYLLEYDSEGNKKSEQFFNLAGTAIKGRTWHYNNQKEISKSVTWIENKKEPRKEIYVSYKRDKDGDLTESTTTEKINGKVFRKDVRYFSNNYLIEWEKYIEGKLESHFINEYKDSVIIRTTRQNKRKVMSLEEAEKEKKKEDKLIANNQKKKKGADIFVTNTEYDDYGNVLSTSQSINNKVIKVTQYSYDDVGNCTKTTITDKEKNQKDEETLEHDDWGNIIKRSSKKNDNIVTVDHYIYEYYPKE